MNYTTKQIIDRIEHFITNDWDLSNQVLYNMCQQFPSNTERQAILAKTLIIGRTYAASIERRRKETKNSIPVEEIINDDFYEKFIVPKFQALNLDEYINEIKSWGNIHLLSLTDEQITQVLTLHKKLSEAFWNETGLHKRSFASKYLHFHLPHIFFIYDSRAYGALGLVLKEVAFGSRVIVPEEADKDYGLFFKKCICVLQYYKLVDEDLHISPRHLDNLLIEIGNQCLRNVK